jgi:hypothetical protein
MNFLPINCSDSDSDTDSDCELNHYRETQQNDEYAFMEQSRVESGMVCNVFNPFKGSFQIEGDVKKQFFDKLNAKYLSNTTNNYAEKQQSRSGILLDFDCYQKSPKPQITDEIMNRLVNTVSKSINNIFDLEDGDSFNVALIKRPLVIAADDAGKLILPYDAKKKLYKMGFHLLIPEIMIEKEMKKFFIYYVWEQIIKDKIFGECEFSDGEDVLDRASAYVPVFFIGSIKPNKNNRKPYPLTSVWRADHWVDEKSNVELSQVNLKRLARYNIPVEFALGNYGIEKYCNKQCVEFNNTGDDLFDKFVEMNRQIQMKLMDKNDKYKPTYTQIQLVIDNKPKFIEYLKIILNSIDVNRARNTKQWVCVLTVCKNLCGLYDIGDEMIDIIDDFSRRGGDRYIGDKDKLIDRFESIEGRGYLTLLLWMFRDDSANEYRTFIAKYLKDFPPDLTWSNLKYRCFEVDTEKKYNDMCDIIVDKMNKKYTIVKAAGKIIIVEQEDDDDCDINHISGRIEQKYTMTCKPAIEDFMANKVYSTKLEDKKGKVMKISAFNVWWMSLKRIEKTKLVFEPYAEGADIPRLAKKAFNIWDGYAVPESICDVPAATLENSSVLRHFKDRWCKGNDIQYRYLMGWYATILQRPDKKPFCSLVLCGKEGAGKGIGIQLLNDIIGSKYFFQPSTSDEVLQGFNSSMSGKKIVYLNELFWGGDKNKAGTLKKLITEKVFTVKTKFLPDYVLKNVFGIVIDGNDLWVVPAGANARRYFVLDVSNELAGIDSDFSIIKELTDELSDPLKVKALARTLYKWDLTNFNDRKPPQTDGLRNQKMLSFTPWQRFIHKALNEGEICGRRDNDTITYSFGDSRVVKNEIFDQYRFVMKDKHMSPKIFWEKVSEMTGGNYVTTKNLRINGNQKRCISVPELEQARNAFQLYIGDRGWKFDDISTTDENEDEGEDDEL